MKYIQKVAKPDYYALIDLFDDRFEKVEIKTSHFKYRTVIRLKINLRFEMNINFHAYFTLIKDGVLTKVKITINGTKIILLSLLMFGFIAVITYLIHPSFFSLLFGLISGLLVYFMIKIQVQRELKKYLRNLLIRDGNAPTR